jgi:hypothetical protein
VVQTLTSYSVLLVLCQRLMLGLCATGSASHFVVRVYLTCHELHPPDPEADGIER